MIFIGLIIGLIMFAHSFHAELYRTSAVYQVNAACTRSPTVSHVRTRILYLARPFGAHSRYILIVSGYGLVKFYPPASRHLQMVLTINGALIITPPEFLSTALLFIIFQACLASALTKERSSPIT